MFCRNCGQEHHPVSRVSGLSGVAFLRRSIDDTPASEQEGSETAGYLMPKAEDPDDPGFTGAIEDYPEDWVEQRSSGPRRGLTEENWRRCDMRSCRQGRKVHPVALSGFLQEDSGSAQPAATSHRSRRGSEISSLGCRRRAGVRRRHCWSRQCCAGSMSRAAQYRKCVANSWDSPTTGRTPRYRLGTSTISCSSPCCVPRHRPPCGPRARTDSRPMSLGGVSCRHSVSLLKIGRVGWNG